MKLCRCQHPGGISWGILEDTCVALLAQAPYQRIERTGAEFPLADVKLLAPCEPQKFLGVGLNYRAHAEEMRKPIPARPLLFLKPPTCVLDPGEPIRLPPESGEVHHEAELAVVIARKMRRVSPAQAREGILGFTCCNDVTARDIQRAEIQYTRAKGFDTFGPVGPVVETELDPHRLTVQALVNGEVRQTGSTADMIFDVFELVSFASRGMTLLPGDVLTTGTPPGVGPLTAGDVVEVSVESVGVLRNPVLAEEEGH
jgi:2-keto-4-pentenoate hydratase/2-oxohepta-3-ene-1,7-dioic acid hydratase in catechol pathway